jgi:hypothetical protein
MATAAIAQPPFDSRITTLAFPLQGGKFGSLQRGYMIWDKPISGYSTRAIVNFLYNPSSVSADYSISDSSVGASLMFPTGFNDTNLRVPLNQTVSWSLLFDRTYELWGTYNTDGSANGNKGNVNGNTNDPKVVGVLADVMAMQQFTGMFVAYSSGNAQTTSPASGTLTGWQGIMQMIPGWVYFGGGGSSTTSLWYYGYVSEWDVTITHWTQYMVPQRCVINITFTMLPPPQSSSGTQKLKNSVPTAGQPSPAGSPIGNQVLVTNPTAGVSGR